MAGYNGYSMSNNAISAYNNGEKPLSKINKDDVKHLNITISEAKLLAKLKIWKPSSYHHTSKFYNSTDFYRVVEIGDEDSLEFILSIKEGDYETPLKEKLKNNIEIKEYEIQMENDILKLWTNKLKSVEVINIIDRINNKIKILKKELKSIENLYNKLALKKEQEDLQKVYNK